MNQQALQDHFSPKMPYSTNLLDRDLTGADEQAGLCEQVTCLIAEVKTDAQPRLFRNGTGFVDIAPRITAPFLHCLNSRQLSKRPGSVITGEGSQLVLMSAIYLHLGVSQLSPLFQVGFYLQRSQASWSAELFQLLSASLPQTTLQSTLSQALQLLP